MPGPQKATNLLEQFHEDSIEEEGPEQVQVYLRLKPSIVKNSSLYVVKSDQCLITSVDTATAGHGRRTQHNVSRMYTFSHIFGPDANQKDIFERVVKDALRKLPDGHNFTLLAYGASGSGKTYTLMGTVNEPGLLPRSLEYVFKVVDAAQIPLYHPGDNGACKLSVKQQDHELQGVHRLRQVSASLREKYRRMSTRLVGDTTKSTLDLSARPKHYVWVSFVEIYNEAIYDLLVTTKHTAASKLLIREDASGNVFVQGATQAFVRSGEEAYDILVAGKRNLQMAATGVHAHSSRSHSLFTISMLTETENGVRSSYVRLCDLAGSERVHRTGNTGARMEESRAINKSLHTLERCLHALRRKQAKAPAIVPYRESKLTRLLGAGLSGARGEAVGMVVTLNPAPEYVHETRHVLQLAAVVKDIQVNNTKAESVSIVDSSGDDTTLAGGAELTRLRADIERLQNELVQAQSLNAKLKADMEDEQKRKALNVEEIVNEIRDIKKEFYTAQIRSLQEMHDAEISELREEYEADLVKTKSVDRTPSRYLHKIVELMKERALLKEALSAERLARARAEELQHRRSVVEERDEKSSESKEDTDTIQLIDEDSDDDDEENTDTIQLIDEDSDDDDEENTDTIQLIDDDSDDDDEEDIDTIQLIDEDSDDDDEEDGNESLEPTFKKEEINRLRRISRQSTLNSTHNTIDKEASLDQNDDTYVNESNQLLDCPNTVKKANQEQEISRNAFSMELQDDSKHDGDVIIAETSQSDKHVNLSKTVDNISNDLFDFYGVVDKPIKPIVKQIDQIKQFAKTTASDSSLSNDYEKNDGKAKYFDDDKFGKIVSPRKTKEKKQLHKVKELIKEQDLFRSPSIVQDEIPEGYVPTTINKIIRESFTKNEIAPTLNKSKLLLKNHESLDLFEKSPCHNEVNIMEQIIESIEKIALDDKKDEEEIQSEESLVPTEDIQDTEDKGSESIKKVALDDQDEEIQPPEVVEKNTMNSSDIEEQEPSESRFIKLTIKQEIVENDEPSSIENDHTKNKSRSDLKCDLSPERKPTNEAPSMLSQSVSRVCAEARVAAARRGSASSASTPSTLERTAIHNPVQPPPVSESPPGPSAPERLSPRAEMRLALDQGTDVLAQQEVWARKQGGGSDPWSFPAACQRSLLRRVASADAVTLSRGLPRRTAPHTTSRSSVYAWKVPESEKLSEMEQLAQVEARTMRSRTRSLCQNGKILGFLRRRASSNSPRREPLLIGTRPFSPRRATVSNNGYYKICFLNGNV